MPISTTRAPPDARHLRQYFSRVRRRRGAHAHVRRERRALAAVLRQPWDDDRALEHPPPGPWGSPLASSTVALRMRAWSATRCVLGALNGSLRRLRESRTALPTAVRGGGGLFCVRGWWPACRLTYEFRAIAVSVSCGTLAVASARGRRGAGPNGHEPQGVSHDCIDILEFDCGARAPEGGADRCDGDRCGRLRLYA